MVVCLCENIKDSQIIEKIEDGLEVEEIILQFNCVNCRRCNSYIEQIYEENKNGSMA